MRNTPFSAIWALASHDADAGAGEAMLQDGVGEVNVPRVRDMIDVNVEIMIVAAGEHVVGEPFVVIVDIEVTVWVDCGQVVGEPFEVTVEICSQKGKRSACVSIVGEAG